MRWYLALILLSASPVYAHWEDPYGCSHSVDRVRGLEWSIEKEGVSDDGRDYIVEWKQDGGLAGRFKEHHQLLPAAQWESDKKPKYMEEVLSIWLDWDGDGLFSEWYLFPRGKSECADAMHFIWDSTIQSFVLFATGKERT